MAGLLGCADIDALLVLLHDDDDSTKLEKFAARIAVLSTAEDVDKQGQLDKAYDDLETSLLALLTPELRDRYQALQPLSYRSTGQIEKFSILSARPAHRYAQGEEPELPWINWDGSGNRMSLLANFETVSVFQGEPPAIFAIKLNAVQYDCRSRSTANSRIQPGDTKNGVAKQHVTWSMLYFRPADAVRNNTPHCGKPFALSDDISVLDHEGASIGNPVSSPRTDRVTARKTRLRNPCSRGCNHSRSARSNHCIVAC